MDQTTSPDETYPLGQLKALYELTSENEIRLAGLAIGILILGLGCFWLGFNSEDNNSKLLLIPTGIGLLLGAIYLFYSWYIRRDVHVLVYDEGLTVIQKDNMVTHRWDDIESIFQNFKVASIGGIRGRTSKIYIIVPKKGAPLEFTEILPNVDELGNTIHQEITTRRLPEDIKRLKAGERLRFGSLSIDNTGII